LPAAALHGSRLPATATGSPGPATLILLGAGLLALIAGSRLFRRR